LRQSNKRATNLNQIIPNLYLGDKHDARLVKVRNSPITAILNVAMEVPTEKHAGVLSVKAAMRDTAEDARINSRAAIQQLDKLMDAGHCVLVHCRHGKSRSAHVVAAYLSEREQVPYEVAYEHVRLRRPQVLAYSIGQEISDKGLGTW